MESIYMKHLGLSISDLLVEYELDRDAKQVNVFLKKHMDPVLLIEFLKMLEDTKEIEIIDRKSQARFGQDINAERYQVELEFAGISFDVLPVQMFKRKNEDKPEFTFSMKAKS